VLQWLLEDCEVVENGEEVDIAGAPADTSSKGLDSIASTILASDNGGRLDISLRISDDETTGGKSVKAELEAVDITKAGTYEGTLALNPSAEDAPKLAVKVKAYDFILWPALAVLLGAGVAWRTARWFDRDRPKKLIQGSIQKADTEYRQLRNSLGPTCPYNLDDVFGEPLTWDCPPASTAQARVLYCAVEVAADSESLASISVKVDDIWSRVRTWEATCGEVKPLRDALAELEGNLSGPDVPGSDITPNDVQLILDTRRLLTATSVPKDGESAEQLLEEMVDKRRAIELWESAWKLAGDGRNLYKALREPQRGLTQTELETLNDHNPDALVLAYLLPAASLADFRDGRLVERFRESLRVLHSLALAHPAPPPTTGMAAKTQFFPELGILTSLVTGVPEFTRPQTPESLVEQVRVGDRWHFLIPSVVTVVAFLGTIYSDHTFGSLWDYVAAFAAGVTGQVVLNWKQLPWFRSYRLGPSAEPGS
jgi:hypothetical protein